MKKLLFTKHALTRLYERRISFTEIEEMIVRGEVIETYPDDTPWPSRLLYARLHERPLHIVLSESPDSVILITAYEPDPALWTPDFTRRKST